MYKSQHGSNGQATDGATLNAAPQGKARLSNTGRGLFQLSCSTLARYRHISVPHYERVNEDTLRPHSSVVHCEEAYCLFRWAWPW